MSMVLTQTRLPKKLVEEIDLIVRKGYYENKSDFIRDAIRKKVFEEQVGSIEFDGNAVEEVRKIRKIVSKQKIDLNEINSLE
ncbi:MAG: ribbon-helix-helix domain-containing protein [Candidatus ainarchaeum sp.]|nr:ribbon-helix-helix domain-containing protein [Candidatus ainarchaeum sp.]